MIKYIYVYNWNMVKCKKHTHINVCIDGLAAMSEVMIRLFVSIFDILFAFPSRPFVTFPLSIHDVNEYRNRQTCIAEYIKIACKQNQNQIYCVVYCCTNSNHNIGLHLFGFFAPWFRCRWHWCFGCKFGCRLFQINANIVATIWNGHSRHCQYRRW